MSLFPDFSNVFNVTKTISQNSNTNPNDVLNTKNALAQTGHYKVPDHGVTDIPDMGMIDGIKKFQQDNGLKVDGVMKPKGPTESKIGETLVQNSISTVKPLTEKIVVKAQPEAPKLKKPTNEVWEQAAKSQKQKTNPWFKSSKLQPISDEAYAENTRSMDGMLNYSENGFLPTLYADALKNGGDKAVAEYANFLNQLLDRKQDRVEGFEQEVMNKVPDSTKKMIRSFETDDGVEKEPKTGQQKSQQSDDEYQDSPKCMELKEQYDNANNEAKKAWQNYQNKLGERDRKGQDGQDALDNLRQLLTETLLEALLAAIPMGRIAAAIKKLKEEVKDPVNWVEVAENAWTLFYSADEEEKLEQEADDYFTEYENWLKDRDRIQLVANQKHDCKTAGWYKG